MANPTHVAIVNEALKNQADAGRKLQNEITEEKANRDTSYKSLEYKPIPIIPVELSYNKYEQMDFESILHEIDEINSNYKSDPAGTNNKIRWYRENPQSPLAKLKTDLSLAIAEQIKSINQNSESHHANEGFIATVIKFSGSDLQITLKGQYGIGNVSGFITGGDGIDPAFLDTLTFLVQGSHGGFGVNLQM